MNIAITQPYFFPYPGYFDLLASVDTVVFLDDAQFTRKGWINRNVLKNDVPIVVPVKHRSQRDAIRLMEIDNSSRWKLKHCHAIESLYGKKAIDHPVYRQYRDCMKYDFLNNLLHRTLKFTCDYLNIKPKFLESSNLSTKETGESRIIEICKLLGANVYYNLPGGVNYYHPQTFHSNGIEIKFIKEHPHKLSILDVLFS